MYPPQTLSPARPYWNVLLINVGLVMLALACGLYFRLPGAVEVWPLPAGRLAFAFMAAILAGSAAPLIWIALSSERAALSGYGLAFAVMSGGMGFQAWRLYALNQDTKVLYFGMAACTVVVFCLILWAAGQGRPVTDTRVTPRLLRWAFLVETMVLAGVGSLLLLQVPNILPWPLAPDTSGMYGWVFLGLAVYYFYSWRKPYWAHTRGQLLGFLVYDLVLIGPLAAQFATLRPEHLLGQMVALGILLLSGAVSVYYLFLPLARRGRMVS
jgi:hypothetical protein